MAVLQETAHSVTVVTATGPDILISAKNGRGLSDIECASLKNWRLNLNMFALHEEAGVRDCG